MPLATVKPHWTEAEFFSKRISEPKEIPPLREHLVLLRRRVKPVVAFKSASRLHFLAVSEEA